MAQKHALIAGATGLVGNELLQQLIRGRQYHTISILSRHEVETSSKRVETIIVNYNKLTDQQMPEVDDVFCCLGTTMNKAGSKDAFRKVDHDYPLRVAEITRRKGAQQYLLVSAMGADESSYIFYNRVKGEVEVAIAKLGFDAFHVFRPSMLLGERTETRIGEQIAQVVMKGMAPLMVGGLKKYQAIPAETVAEAMVHVARKELSGTFVFESDKIQALVQYA
ncbi:MAG: oxidoreductase [Tunicatimonas sp.]